MWKRKEIKDISASSVVDLKAELFKASETVVKNKRSSKYLDEAVVSGTRIKKQYSRPAPPPPIDLSPDEDENKTEHDSKLEASYVALKRKAETYDKMRNNVYEDDDTYEESSEVLVDFLRKAYVHPIDKTESESLGYHTEELLEDPWIEIKDDFGRTRLVRKSVAEKMEKDNEALEEKQRQLDMKIEYQRILDSQNDQLQSEITCGMMSSDMSRERKRQEWESEAQSQSEKSNHFDSSKEIRTMGVGFYQFSNNSDDRSKQMNELKQLRDSTITERQKTATIKESKRDAREQRMKMILQKSQAQTIAKQNAVNSKNIDALFESLQ